MTAKQYWLMKSEPDTFGIADLERVRVEPWSGVRSMFARFHMRQMNVGDEVLFHHSSCTPPGVAGLARVVRTHVIDETQFDPASPYHDPKATREKPIWDCVDVEYVATFPHYVSLERIRADPTLKDMMLLKQGRLSVQPVKPHEFARVVALGHEPPPPSAPKPRRAANGKAARPKAKRSAKQPKARPSAKRAVKKRAPARRA